MSGANRAGDEILFLAHRMPFPPDRGDKIRSHHILRHLAGLAPVHVACFADDAADAAAEPDLAALAASHVLVRRAKPLALAGVEAVLRGAPVSLTAFHHGAIASYVEALVASGRIGAIYVFSGQMGQYVPADRSQDGRARLVVDFCDVDSAKFDAYAAQKGRLRGWIDAREGRLLRAEETRLAARADASLLISRDEAALFRQRLPAGSRARIEVLGNGIDNDYFCGDGVVAEPRLAALPAPRIVFTGQMDYAPNVAAAVRAARRIMPLVRAQVPGASFHIIGRNPTEAVRALAGEPGVHVWGRVADMRVWLAGATLAMVPLEIARGVQNKVLEAMAMGLPVVLTPGAATGIDAAAGEDFAIATSDEDLAASVIALVADPMRAAAMGASARRFVVERQSWAAAMAPLGALIGVEGRVRNAA